MSLIPVSYYASRERFRSRLPLLVARWPGARLESLPLPSDPGLTIDILAAEPAGEKERLLVLTSGLHGIEGYLGSAALELFLREFAPRLDPAETGLLLVHAINPWGMQNWERNNPANVDLNRNFIQRDFGALADANADYHALSPYLNPGGALQNLPQARLSFIASTIKNLAAFGARRIRESALMGQYRFPRGIYFGGAALQFETAAMMEVYLRAFAGYQEVVHLDFHTGYGPRGRMTLVTSPYEQASAGEISARFHASLVAAANPDEFYSIQGDMIDWEYRMAAKEFPGMKFFGATCEFGTYGDSILQAARSLRITVLKNRLKQYGGSREASRWVEREYRELYLPSDPAWLEKAMQATGRIFASVVEPRQL